MVTLELALLVLVTSSTRVDKAVQLQVLVKHDGQAY